MNYQVNQIVHSHPARSLGKLPAQFDPIGSHVVDRSLKIWQYLTTFGRWRAGESGLWGLLVLMLLVGCTRTPSTLVADQVAADDTDYTLTASLTAAALVDGAPVQVAATTSIISDIVAQVGGDAIALHTLIEPGVDPHSFATTPQTLRTLSSVDVIFVNGLHLEEGLEAALIEAGRPLVSVNEMVAPLGNEPAATVSTAATDRAEDEHGLPDPHTWQSVPNVQQWVTTIDVALSALDPARADTYHTNAKAYQQALQELDQEIRTQVATIPAKKRKIVTDHETFNYFAHEYGFTIIGSLAGSLSTASESSAQAFAALQDQISAENAPAIFVGTTVNPALAEQLARDLNIAVVPLYSDALGDPNGPAATYLDFMRHNVHAIVSALQPE